LVGGRSVGSWESKADRRARQIEDIGREVRDLVSSEDGLVQWRVVGRTVFPWNGGGVVGVGVGWKFFSFLIRIGWKIFLV
jgi:hypothetical protein